MVQSLDDARRRGRSGAAGRVPPHNLEAEESLLGAMILSRGAIATAVEQCGADDFYKPAHAHIFDAVPTVYNDLDERLSGLQPSNLVIVGGRPSMGKTAFALGLVAHAAMESRLPVLLFSLEMSHLELTQRLLCAEARVDATRMRNGRLLESDWPKISTAIGHLGEAPIFIDDNPNVTVMDIRAKARRLKSRGGLGLVGVDYLQLMSGRTSAENRQVEVSEISRGLKILARELEVPVVALSPLSRNLEMRADKRPVLADLRESGCMPASTRLLR